MARIIAAANLIGPQPTDSKTADLVVVVPPDGLSNAFIGFSILIRIRGMFQDIMKLCAFFCYRPTP